MNSSHAKNIPQRSRLPRCARSLPSWRFLLLQPGHLLRPMALVFFDAEAQRSISCKMLELFFSVFHIMALRCSHYKSVWMIKLAGYCMGSSTTSPTVRMPWIHGFPTSWLWSWGFDFTVESASVRLGCRVGELRNVVGNHIFVNDISLDPTWGLFFEHIFAWPRIN